MYEGEDTFMNRKDSRISFLALAGGIDRLLVAIERFWVEIERFQAEINR